LTSRCNLRGSLSGLALASVLSLMVAACFAPAYPTEIPCSETQSCPPGQSCDVDGVCRYQPRPGPGDPDAMPGDPDAMQPEPICTDDVRNGGETGVDCGGPACPGCGAGGPCNTGDDCQSQVCSEDGTCAAPVCGDGVLGPGEDCDTAESTATCDEDCTLPECGDGVFNPVFEDCDEGAANTAACDRDCSAAECGDGLENPAAGEECDDGNAVDNDGCSAECQIQICGNGEVDPGEDCDLGAANSDFGRCGSGCFWGAGLDGTFGAEWEILTPPAGSGRLEALDSFHYSGMRYIHDMSRRLRYEPATGTSSEMPMPPFGSSQWADAAVAPDSLWVPRGGSIFRYDLASETWSTATSGIPDGTSQLTAAVFDGDGFVWYHGPGSDLVRYDPAAGTTTAFTHSGVSLAMFETRVAYDPVTNSIVFSGFGSDRLALFDLASQSFSIGPASPRGTIRDNTCQDRSGHIYTGTNNGSLMMQYDVATGTWTELPALPFPHDNQSTCVVSQDGFLYYGTTGGFARLPLGRRNAPAGTLGTITRLR
jgi:cysteine-rich repeat protein